MVTLEYQLFDQCDVRYFQVFLCAEIKSGLRTGLCKVQRQPCTGKMIFLIIHSFHIEYFTDYTARETKLCLVDQLTAVVKNSNEDKFEISSQQGRLTRPKIIQFSDEKATSHSRTTTHASE